MSGIETLGLLASATQLAAYIIRISSSISEIYHRIQDAPKRIQEHTKQIRQLLDTAKLIQNHELLQREEINAHLDSTVGQARLLSETLAQVKGQYIDSRSLKRYWKILNGHRERDILSSFVRLEQEKSALLLCISLAHTDLLANIQGNLDLSHDSIETFMATPNNGQRRSVSLVSRLIFSKSLSGMLIQASLGKPCRPATPAMRIVVETLSERWPKTHLAIEH